MKVKITILLAVLVVGCHTSYHTSDFYLPINNPVSAVNGHGFHVQTPEAWLVYDSSQFDDSEKHLGIEIYIPTYEWSPIIHFNMMTNSLGWQADLPRMDTKIIRLTSLHEITVSEDVSHFNKFTGHGIHKVGKNDKYRSEYFIFYPDEMPGTRLVVILRGSPNKASLREMDEIIRSVSYHPDR